MTSCTPSNCLLRVTSITARQPPRSQPSRHWPNSENSGNTMILAKIFKTTRCVRYSNIIAYRRGCRTVLVFDRLIQQHRYRDPFEHLCETTRIRREQHRATRVSRGNPRKSQGTLHQSRLVVVVNWTFLTANEVEDESSLFLTEGQSLAGAISTGTHGASSVFGGSMQDGRFVTRLQIPVYRRPTMVMVRRPVMRLKIVKMGRQRLATTELPVPTIFAIQIQTNDGVFCNRDEICGCDNGPDPVGDDGV
jgi:hypothetical protein